MHIWDRFDMCVSEYMSKYVVSSNKYIFFSLYKNIFSFESRKNNKVLFSAIVILL